MTIHDLFIGKTSKFLFLAVTLLPCWIGFIPGATVAQLVVAGASTKASHLRKASSEFETDHGGTFSLDNCSSYDNTWLFELHHSCSFGVNGCECTDAQEKIQSGDILCQKGTTRCPESCSVCDYCMEQAGCLL